ncbi:2-C-methyl-D-erythritol 2,4-cyclodiphosphate synthase [Thermomicrobium sp. CFH 73360]|uniref:2-C-methyl-D-erythritol 2,4-cyclodiphosphate synthase n=1 Tax=Thermomicrobium roseum TaxID=500 RepID=A0A7C1G2W7_THERO|nr:2-C-methyl-D-erythritol 2,4-cyclodiphosphate synthase [Thermomicrobium sp. CFH 73360]MCM8746094.1 2-C-methyl-D-erythritol 2,4-cyclodiphosphate synthase [Thermomicrobium sp. CFH 73360]GBD20061.1 2-C-methyl-D-erythritol 2,4-cyclodiphosphate synthase [bacterium HR28]
MIRVGLGYDVHPLVTGRRLVLGGVEIPGTVGLAGHSDADVLAHAIGDAVLGAAGLGDLGTHFPPEDERWRNVSSLELLRHIRRLVQEAGWRIAYVDATLVAEYPRIAPFRERMRERIAEALAITTTQVNLKATTNERLGFIGRGEGIAALAVATLESEHGAQSDAD